MRFSILAMAIAAVVMPAGPALAQHHSSHGNAGHHSQRHAGAHHTTHRNVTVHRRVVTRPSHIVVRDWHRYRSYDWNRHESGQSRYYADRYYRDARYYQPRRLTRNDRFYRGRNGNYYCRRSDGTTGLIVGAALGGILGNSVGYGDSRVFATILGAGAGAALGSSIDRGQVVCR